VFASQLRNADPVFARGTGRLTFEFMAEIDQGFPQTTPPQARV